jgi:L-asparaginase
MATEKRSGINPRIIIHGGAGNITRKNLPEKSRQLYRDALLDTVRHANSMLSVPGATALDVATFAVELLENNPLFNAGRGAVYTTAGTHELEASVMVSRGYRKRGVGVMGVTKAKNPIKLAREMLIRGELDDGGGAHGHAQLHGKTCDNLTEEWGLETVKPSYFWTRRRWDEHRKGLGLESDGKTYRKHKKQADKISEKDAGLQDETVNASEEMTASIDNMNWDGHEYLPQGTVGAVVLDSSGTICAATSTGGLTNKLPGRIGDTPTIGAGFFAEEWTTKHYVPVKPHSPYGQNHLSLAAMVSDCIPGLSGYMHLPTPPSPETRKVHSIRAVGLSGTGNGDSFLRVSAARTTAAIVRFSSSSRDEPGGYRYVALQKAVTDIAGPGGMLQQSAEDRWHKTGEGEGGMIGIELKDGQGEIVFDFNCGGMFHAWVDQVGRDHFQVYHR